MDTLKCFYCSESKTEDLFYRITRGPYGKSKCKKCQSAYTSAYIKARPEKVKFNRMYSAKSTRVRKKRNQQYVFDLKRRSPCTDCKNYFHPHVLDYDHKEGHKTNRNHAIGHMAAHSVPVSLLDEEIAKCELVCANCHRIRTTIRRIGKEAYEADLLKVGPHGFEP